MMKVAMVKMAAVVLCLVAMSVVVGAIRAAQGDAPSAATAASTAPAKLPFTLAKETTSITAPANADGTPDYLKALNDRYSKGVTPENNAFVAWLGVVGTGDDVLASGMKARVLEMCGAAPSLGLGWQPYGEYLNGRGAGAQEQAKAAEVEVAAAKRLWEAVDYPELAEYLEAQKKYLDGVAAAFARTRYWSPYVSPDRRVMLYMAVPGPARMHTGALSLCDRATLRMKAGDFDGFLSDVMAVKRMARRVGSGASLFERLKGLTIDQRANDTLGAAAGAGVLDAKEAEVLGKELGGLEPLPSLREALDVAGRWERLDIAVLVASGQADALVLAETVQEGGGDVVEHASARDFERREVDWDRALKRINTEIDADIAALAVANMEELQAAQKRFSARVEAAGVPASGSFSKRAGETREQYTDRVADTILAQEASPRIEEAYRQCVMRDAMVAALVAAARYRADKGTWPQQLGELVPAYLKEVPKDIYRPAGNGPVQFVVSKAGARIYSIGRNRTDDHGVSGGKTKGDDIIVGVSDPATSSDQP